MGMRTISMDLRGRAVPANGIPWRSLVPGMTPRVGPFTRIDVVFGKVQEGSGSPAASVEPTLVAVLTGQLDYADGDVVGPLLPGSVAWSPAGTGVVSGGSGGRATAVRIGMPASDAAPAVLQEAPSFERDGASLRVLAGTFEGYASSLPELPVLVEISLPAGQRIVLDAAPEKRVFAFVATGGLVAPEGVAPGKRGTCWVFHANGKQVALEAASKRATLLVGIGAR